MPADLALLEVQGMTVDAYVLPLTWKFTDSQTVVPFEYTNDVPTEDHEATNNGHLFQPAFLQELYSFLNCLGLEGELGITRLWTDRDTHGFEKTDKAARVSTTTYMDDKEEAKLLGGVQVTWDFSGKALEWMCSTSCTSRYC